MHSKNIYGCLACLLSHHVIFLFVLSFERAVSKGSCLPRGQGLSIFPQSKYLHIFTDSQEQLARATVYPSVTLNCFVWAGATSKPWFPMIFGA